VIDVDIKNFEKERDEALLSLDKSKILNFAKKYSLQLPSSEKAFWGGIHKAIILLKSASDEQKQRSKTWLLVNGFKLDIF
jgi:hypothetical protein